MPIVAFILSDGHLLLNVNFFDETYQCILRIVNNALAYSIDPWDVNLTGRTLTIRSAHRAILLEMRFEPPNRVDLTRGRLLHNEVELLLRPDYALVTNNCSLISGCHASGVPYGLWLGPNDSPGPTMISMSGINRYLGDRREAEKWAREALANIGDRAEGARGGPDA